MREISVSKSQALNIELIWQVVQGIGGGGMMILISIIFSDVVPTKERGLWQGWLNVLYTVGMSIGAPLGIRPLRPVLPLSACFMVRANC